MDLKNTDNKNFFIGNASVSLDDMNKLPNQTVNQVIVQLPRLVQGISEKEVHHSI
jgi:hypothetical protein